VQPFGKLALMVFFPTFLEIPLSAACLFELIVFFPALQPVVFLTRGAA